MSLVNRLVLAAVVCLAAAVPCGAADDAKEKRLNEDVQIAIEAFKKEDSGMKKLFESAEGCVVFPSVGKGGFILGGAHGRGLAYEKGKLIGSATLTQYTIGAQVGGQEFAEVIFFENKAALDRFKESKFEMSAQVSAVASAEGVASHARYVEGVMIFTKAKTGLMAEASVGGQKLKFTPLAKES
jgi:lipid-binding SYLF domain-containing protein